MTLELDESERLRDAAVGVLSTLRHTPIGMMGINRNTHFTVDSVERWHEIGDALAPKDKWESLLNLAGTKSLSMLGVRSDKYAGHIQVTVEPSVQVPNGIFVGYNDHYALSTVDHQPTSRDEYDTVSHKEGSEPTIQKGGVAVKILSEEWHAAFLRSSEAIQFVGSLGVKGAVADAS